MVKHKSEGKAPKIYDSVRSKDVVSNALDSFKFYGNGDTPKHKSPWHYKTAMIAAMRLLLLEGASNIVGGGDLIEIGDTFQDIYNFFEALDTDSFSKLTDIFDIYNYSHGKADEKIDILMKKLKIE